MQRPVPATILLFAALPALPQSDLDAVLARMDAAGASFRSVTAQLVRADYTAILQDTTTESGTIRLLRLKPGDVRVLIDLTEPDPRTATLAGRKAEIYYPKIATVHEYDLGKHKNVVEQFLLLGFGTSGRDLARAYSIKLAGTEAIDGHAVTHLELTPKAANLREHLTKVELWINSDGYPLRQRFHKPSGDHTTVNYSSLRVNPGLSPEALTLKLPSNVKREFPGK